LKAGEERFGLLNSTAEKRITGPTEKSSASQKTQQLAERGKDESEDLTKGQDTKANKSREVGRSIWENSNRIQSE